MIVERLGKLLLSINECPSDEPLVINEGGGFVERSFSDIVRDNNDDCWEFIDDSRLFVGNSSGGMFEFDNDGPVPEYNDDGIILPFANVTVDDVDDEFIWEILLRICWFNSPKINEKCDDLHYFYVRDE